MPLDLAVRSGLGSPDIRSLLVDASARYRRLRGTLLRMGRLRLLFRFVLEPGIKG